MHYRRWRAHGDATFVKAEHFVGTVVERLNRFVDRSAGPDGCWPWTRSCTPYGQIWDGARNVPAHRFAYELASGRAIPDGLEVLHSCDNPPCCNPAHLSVGSHARNMAEMSQRDRASSGERSARARLSAVDVTRIRQLADNGVLHTEIAAAVGIHPSTVSRIARGKRRPDAGGTPGSRRRRHLTDDQVAAIRQLRAAGVPVGELAVRFGISGPYVSQLTTGRRRITAPS